MIIDLLIINLIVTLVFMSGFVDSIDEAISKRWKFHHLPKPFSCCLCSTFWVSLIWVIATGHLSLLSIALCLINAHLTEVMTPLITLLKNALLKIIELANKVIWKEN